MALEQNRKEIGSNVACLLSVKTIPC